MAETKQFPTPGMLKARERLANMTPEEREAGLKEMRDELRRHARLSLLTRRDLRETDMFEKKLLDSSDLDD